MAVHEVSLGNPTPRLGVPNKPGDDVAWTELTPEALFGEFPPSETLHEWATTSAADEKDKATRIVATRQTLLVLDDLLARLEPHAEAGPEAVAAQGAELIAQSDRDYFTADLRQHKVIPLLVENPYPHELHDEGKSFQVSGRDVPADVLNLTRTTVLRRRLADGDIAIERYDISRETELDHLVIVLEPLIPPEEDGNIVWIWVTGPVEGDGKWLGPRALDYRKELEQALTRASVNRDRIQVVTRHARTLDSKTPAEEFVAEAKAHREAGWTLRLNMRTAVLEKKLQAE